MESRACYGYYGEGHGASGEQPPKENRGGYRISDYYFLIDWHNPYFSKLVIIRAKNFKNAERRAKAFAKSDGGTYIGEDPEHIHFNHFDDED